jgi:hypothetical protein
MGSPPAHLAELVDAERDGAAQLNAIVMLDVPAVPPTQTATPAVRSSARRAIPAANARLAAKREGTSDNSRLAANQPDPVGLAECAVRLLHVEQAGAPSLRDGCSRKVE